MPWIPLIIGAGLGIAQGIEQNAQEQAAKPAKATAEEFAPFTGSQAANVPLHPAQFVSDIAGGVASGARYGQGGYGTPGNSYGSAQNPAPMNSSQNGYGNPYQVPNPNMAQWAPANPQQAAQWSPNAGGLPWSGPNPWIMGQNPYQAGGQ